VHCLVPCVGAEMVCTHEDPKHEGKQGVKKATNGPEESCAGRAGPLYNVEKKEDSFEMTEDAHHIS